MTLWHYVGRNASFAPLIAYGRVNSKTCAVSSACSAWFWSVLEDLRGYFWRGASALLQQSRSGRCFENSARWSTAGCLSFKLVLRSGRRLRLVSHALSQGCAPHSLPYVSLVDSRLPCGRLSYTRWPKSSTLRRKSRFKSFSSMAWSAFSSRSAAHAHSAQVVSKILKHAREVTSGSVHGLLLGLDLDGTLEVSNSFALPHHVSDEDEKSAKSSGACFVLDEARLIAFSSTIPGVNAQVVAGGPG